MTKTQIAARVTNGNRYVARHGKCCHLLSKQYGCSSHGQPPASGYLRDSDGRQFVWVLGSRVVGQPAPRYRHYV